MRSIARTTGWLCLAMGALTAAAQEPARAEPPKTKLETALMSSGTLVVKEFYLVGSLGKLKVEAIAIAEPGKKPHVLGARVEITEGGAGSRVEKRASLLDTEELDDLIKSLDYMGKLLAEWKGKKREAYTEVVFTTKGDFRLGFYQKGDEQQIFASSGAIARADFWTQPGDLPRLRDLLTQAADKLKGL